jgi:hypothetical protein
MNPELILLDAEHNGLIKVYFDNLLHFMHNVNANLNILVIYCPINGSIVSKYSIDEYGTIENIANVATPNHFNTDTSYTLAYNAKYECDLLMSLLLQSKNDTDDLVVINIVTKQELQRIRLSNYKTSKYMVSDVIKLYSNELVAFELDLEKV